MSLNLTILALDPGVTTGYAFAHLSEDEMSIAYDQEAMRHREFYNFIPRSIDHIICEGFTFRQGAALDGANLFPVEIIGILELWRQDIGRYIPTYFQNASIQGKSAYWSDDKLKQDGIYRRGIDHGRSALKHLLYWYTFGAGFQFLKDQKKELVDEQWFRRSYLTD